MLERARALDVGSPRVADEHDVGGASPSERERVPEDARVRLARPGPRRGHEEVDRAGEAGLGDRRLEVPVPVRAHREPEALRRAARASVVGDLGVGVELPVGAPGVRARPGSPRTRRGARRPRRASAEQALVLPRDVVVAAAGLVEVLDPVEVTVPPPVAQGVGELVPPLGEDVLDRVGVGWVSHASVP